MSVTRSDSELLHRAGDGDPAARDQLLQRHRPRLRRLVMLRLDRRLMARVDPSDVVQETLAEAARKLPAYVRLRPLPFYPWMRQLALRGWPASIASTCGRASGACCAKSARCGRYRTSPPWR